MVYCGGRFNTWLAVPPAHEDFSIGIGPVRDVATFGEYPPMRTANLISLREERTEAAIEMRQHARWEGHQYDHPLVHFRFCAEIRNDLELVRLFAHHVAQHVHTVAADIHQ